MKLLLLSLILACGGAPSTKNKEICGDGYDNDDDGLADCADDDCLGVEFDMDGDGEPDACPEFCDDGIDNDGDDLVDCDDPGCDGTAFCPEICTDGRDNDKDQLWDCQDSDCADECDKDGDGYFNAEFSGDDCDDDNPYVYPFADEVCDGFDNDCNGLVDEDDKGLDSTTLLPWYLDSDGDGFGQTGDVEYACQAPAGRVEFDADCNDADEFVNPNEQEVCDGIDNDCDQLIDEADPSCDLTTAQTWYPDSDGDGFGVNAYPTDSCSPIPGTAPNPNDCDDTNASITTSGMWIIDNDGDGYGSGPSYGPSGCVPPGPEYVSENTPLDCDDSDPLVSPGAADPCGDGIDWDCDTLDCPYFFDGFEFGLVSPWTTGGAANWFAQNSTVYAGLSAGECGDIGNSQDSWVLISKSFPAGGEIVAQHKGSTESGWDFLYIYVDGVEMASFSGTWGWQQLSVPVGPGLHDIQFKYQKDSSVDGGSDTVWLDDVELRGAAP